MKTIWQWNNTKVKLTLNWPIYVGYAILDLSRMLINDFHNNYIKKKYPDLALLFAIEIASHTKFKWITCMKTFMLISICSVFLDTRKKIHSVIMKTKEVISNMNDELKGEVIKEFVSLKAKMYSLKTKKEEMKKAIFWFLRNLEETFLKKLV